MSFKGRRLALGISQDRHPIHQIVLHRGHLSLEYKFSLRAPMMSASEDEKCRDQKENEVFEFEIHNRIRILGLRMNCKKTLLVWMFAVVGAGLSGISAPSDSTSTPDRPLSTGFTEPERVIHKGDMVKITLRMPNRAIGSLEPVQKNGEVATPDGSFVKAEGITLHALTTNLAAMYAPIPTYQNLKIETLIWSSPYKVIRYQTDPPLAISQTSTNNPPPTLFPRVFRSTLTLWEAIQLEGGIPRGVRPDQVHVLKRDLTRKSYNCSGAGGIPDGTNIVETGDCLFLVPEGTPLSGIFD